MKRKYQSLILGNVAKAKISKYSFPKKYQSLILGNVDSTQFAISYLS